MNTIQEFIDFCEKHQGQRFWNVLDEIKSDELDLKAVIWRDAIRSNTDYKLELYTFDFILATYKAACDMFGKEEFDQDLTQFYNDNKE